MLKYIPDNTITALFA